MLVDLDPVSKATVDGILQIKERQFSDAVIKSHGVIVDALSSTEIVTPGEALEVTTNVYFGRLTTGENSGGSAANIKASVGLLAPANWRVESVQPVEEQLS